MWDGVVSPKFGFWYWENECSWKLTKNGETNSYKKLKNKKKKDFVKKFGSSFMIINPNQLYNYLVNNDRNSSTTKMLSRVPVLLFGVKKSNVLEKSHQKINY